MRSRKLLLTLLVTPALLLAGCSGSALSVGVAPQSLGQISQVAQQVTAVPAINSASQASSTTASSTALAAFENTFEQIYTNVNPSVVNIQVTSQGSGSSSLQLPSGHPSITPGVQEALGSGFVWDTEGHIVTNNHVIDGADKITVTFADGTTVDAKLVGADPNSDLAVLQVNVPASQIHPVQMGDSSQVKVGEIAIAIGNPYGLSGTMTEGIISGLSRTLPVGLDSSSTQQGPTYSIPDIIQTDAAINPGNSGGVLVNTEGQLIGVTAAIRSPVDANSGIGFVIPSAIVSRVVPSLIQTGKYEHAWLGISGTTLDSSMANAMSLNPTQQGVLIVAVSPNSPAEKAGLQGSNQQANIDGQQAEVGGDVITAIDNHPVKKFEDLSSYLANNTQVGQTVSLTILRQGSEKTVQLALGALPQQPGQ